ncbi:YjbH domain-containing protein [Oleisolibacter albus]|uniref:YjbH domain-containing protein n=1 Tax=Oleisolibacter albus TaxID=2171757 RepID=UPI0012D7CC0D|nr:YjbH domain-containing protein [Oleisolibacter albus]
MRRLLLPLVSCLTSPQPAGADGFVPLPASRPEAFLPGTGTAWLATEQDRYGTLTGAGLIPLQSLGLTARQGLISDSLADLALRLRADGEDGPAVLLGLNGLGGDERERADTMLLGWRIGPVQLSAGTSWSGAAAPLHGRPAPIGQARWTPADGSLTLAVQAGRYGLETRPRIDAGWRPLPWLEIGSAWQSDRGLVATMALRLHPEALPVRPPPRPVLTRGNDGTVWAELSRSESAATDLGLALRQAQPQADGTIVVAGHTLGLPGVGLRLLDADVARALKHEGSPAEIGRHARLSQAPLPPSTGRRLDFDLSSRLALGPGSDGSGWIYRWTADAGAHLRPLPGLQLSAALRGTLDDTAWLLQPPQREQPVRSDLDAYATHPVSLSRALVQGWGRPLADMAVLVEAGHLEEMYGGAGGELEWRPLTARWAVGLDAHHVWKRRPGSWRLVRGSDRTTGALALRWDLDRRSLSRIELSGGRFLGGDWGGELRLDRHFTGGLRLAAGLTATAEGPAARLTVTLPLGSLAGLADSWAELRVEPLARDRGQRLDRPLSLPDLTTPAGYGRIAGSWNRLLGP